MTVDEPEETRVFWEVRAKSNPSGAVGISDNEAAGLRRGTVYL
jgi:hypothetical protein